MLSRCTHLALATAGFALGCLPTARLVAARAGVRIDTVGTGNPGAANVRRSLGARHGALVLVGDAAKGAAPVLAGRALGADDAQMGLLCLAPVAGHVVVVGGRGVAAALGAATAADPPAMALVAPIFLLGTYRRVHAPSVLVSYVAYPLVRRLLGRSTGAVRWSALLTSFLAVVRLRGSLSDARQGRLDRRMLWERLVNDRSPVPDGGR
jgi:glycerol-3-phosphate acyltransferase PlsY